MTILHLCAGTVVLVSGAVALTFAKGGQAHRIAGRSFVIAMLAIFVTGLAIVEARLSFPNVVLAGYFPATAWLTIWRKEKRVGVPEIVAMLVGATGAALLLRFGVQAAMSPDGSLESAPAAIYFVFGSVAALAVLLDLKVLLQRGVVGVSRIVRHLWRMCYALFMACGAFFLGQQDMLPEALRGSPLLYAAALAPLALMFAWLVALRFLPRFKTRPVGP
jgi:hypothetical protein